MDCLKKIFFAVLACVLCSCGQQDAVTPQLGIRGVAVGFCSGGDDAATRTAIEPDGLTASWEKGDRIAVWAENSAGEFTLDNTAFSVYGTNGTRAFFTATIAEAMPQDRYTYYAVYPIPESVSGTKATFTIPSVQDGKVSSGADILIGEPSVHGPLAEVKELSDYTPLGLQMEHILHHFRFYVPEGEDRLGGEAIEKIVLTFPKPVAGKITADFSDISAAPVLSEGAGELTLNLAEPLTVSSSSEKKYAVASLFPTSFGASETFGIKVYSATKIGTADPVSLEGRTFEAGHSTPVRLLLTDVKDYARVRFTVSANNLGEDADAVRLTAPEGCVWGDGSSVYEYRPGHKITAGETFDIVFEDTDAFDALAGKDITVTFDTEHVDATVTAKMPGNGSSSSLAEISAAIPYLLYEDFSGVETFSSHDNYATSSAGSKSPVSFLGGWTGGRVGAEAGKCIRIACRRETSADYDARVDSAPIVSLKKSCDIKVSYDYGINNRYGGVVIISDGNVGQTVHVGYVTDTKGYDSGDDAGTFEDDNSFYAKEYTGSYTSTPNSDTRIIHSAPEGTVRITWRSVVEHRAGTTNSTCWFYLDNVKVQIAE